LEQGVGNMQHPMLHTVLSAMGICMMS